MVSLFTIPHITSSGLATDLGGSRW